jgi:hypothetical protein
MSATNTPPILQPSVFRFYAGMIAVGFASGIVWTISLLNARWISHEHAMTTLWAIVGFLMAFQVIGLWREGRRLKMAQAELDKMYQDLKDRGMLPQHVDEESNRIYRM